MLFSDHRCYFRFMLFSESRKTIILCKKISQIDVPEWQMSDISAETTNKQNSSGYKKNNLAISENYTCQNVWVVHSVYSSKRIYNRNWWVGEHVSMFPTLKYDRCCFRKQEDKDVGCYSTGSQTNVFPIKKDTLLQVCYTTYCTWSQEDIPRHSVKIWNARHQRGHG